MRADGDGGKLYQILVDLYQRLFFIRVCDIAQKVVSRAAPKEEKRAGQRLGIDLIDKAVERAVAADEDRLVIRLQGL